MTDATRIVEQFDTPPTYEEREVASTLVGYTLSVAVARCLLRLERLEARVNASAFVPDGPAPSKVAASPPAEQCGPVESHARCDECGNLLDDHHSLTCSRSYHVIDPVKPQQLCANCGATLSRQVEQRRLEAVERQRAELREFNGALNTANAGLRDERDALQAREVARLEAVAKGETGYFVKELALVRQMERAAYDTAVECRIKAEAERDAALVRVAELSPLRDAVGRLAKQVTAANARAELMGAVVANSKVALAKCENYFEEYGAIHDTYTDEEGHEAECPEDDTCECELVIGLNVGLRGLAESLSALDAATSPVVEPATETNPAPQQTRDTASQSEPDSR